MKAGSEDNDDEMTRCQLEWMQASRKSYLPTLVKGAAALKGKLKQNNVPHSLPMSNCRDMAGQERTKQDRTVHTQGCDIQ